MRRSTSKRFEPIPAARPVFTHERGHNPLGLLSSSAAIESTQAEAVGQTLLTPIVPNARIRQSPEKLQAGEFFQ